MPRTFELINIRTSEEQEFSGPFDALLSLLGEQKLDITELSLSRITQQYIEYVNSLDENREGELADFLVVATKLLLLKSRALLPQFAGEADDEGPTLEEQLRLYKRFVLATKHVQSAWLSEDRSFFRTEPPRRSDIFVAPENLTDDSLHESMVLLLSRLKPPKPIPKTHIDKTVSVKEKINRVWDILRSSKQAHFQDMLDSAQSKTDIIVSFLALLELSKQHKINLSQSQSFHDILIQKV